MNAAGPIARQIARIVPRPALAFVLILGSTA